MTNPRASLTPRRAPPEPEFRPRILATLLSRPLYRARPYLYTAPNASGRQARPLCPLAQKALLGEVRDQVRSPEEDVLPHQAIGGVAVALLHRRDHSGLLGVRLRDQVGE